MALTLARERGPDGEPVEGNRGLALFFVRLRDEQGRRAPTLPPPARPPFIGLAHAPCTEAGRPVQPQACRSLGVLVSVSTAQLLFLHEVVLVL